MQQGWRTQSAAGQIDFGLQRSSLCAARNDMANRCPRSEREILVPWRESGRSTEMTSMLFEAVVGAAGRALAGLALAMLMISAHPAAAQDAAAPTEDPAALDRDTMMVEVSLGEGPAGRRPRGLSARPERSRSAGGCQSEAHLRRQEDDRGARSCGPRRAPGAIAAGFSFRFKASGSPRHTFAAINLRRSTLGVGAVSPASPDPKIARRKASRSGSCV